MTKKSDDKIEGCYNPFLSSGFFQIKKENTINSVQICYNTYIIYIIYTKNDKNDIMTVFSQSLHTVVVVL